MRLQRFSQLTHAFLLSSVMSLLATGCASSNHTGRATEVAPPITWETVPIKIDTLRAVDLVRHRSIPLVTYTPATSASAGQVRLPLLKVALLNHAYHGKNTEYSFLAKNLVAHGYYVVSLQHELPGDDPLPLTGIPAVVRRPNWERGVQNIQFVLQELKRTHPDLDYHHLLLMGHSNGGDMAALFAQKHPRQVARLISFDNRRVPLPRTRQPHVLSLRSSDQPADEGVLPTATEQTKFGIEIVKLPNTIHNDMWDGATLAQRQEMNQAVARFLEE